MKKPKKGCSKPKPHRSKRRLTKSYKSFCPQCRVALETSARGLVEHYRTEHSRPPSQGEYHQFRTGCARKKKSTAYPVGYDSHPREVSGGLPSLGRRS